MPSSKNGSSNKATSSTITCAPALRRQVTESTKDSLSLSPSEKRRVAPGARSWTISSMAVPSSPLPAAHPNPPGTPVAAGTLPVTTDCAMWSMPSEITPTVMPLPSKPAARACGPSAAGSPSLVTDPARRRPGRTGTTERTSASPASVRRSLVRSQPRASRCSALTRSTLKPVRASSARSVGDADASETRTCTFEPRRAASGTGASGGRGGTGSSPDAGVRSCVSSFSSPGTSTPRAASARGNTEGPSIGSAAPATPPASAITITAEPTVCAALACRRQVSRACRDEPPGGSHRRMLSARTPSPPRPCPPPLSHATRPGAPPRAPECRPCAPALSTFRPGFPTAGRGPQGAAWGDGEPHGARSTGDVGARPYAGASPSRPPEVPPVHHVAGTHLGAELRGSPARRPVVVEDDRVAQIPGAAAHQLQVRMARHRRVDAPAARRLAHADAEEVELLRLREGMAGRERGGATQLGQDPEHADGPLARVGDERQVEHADPPERLGEERDLALREGREAPVRLEGVAPQLGELRHAPARGHVPQRHQRVAAAARGLDRALPSRHQLGAHADLVVDQPLLGLEARVLQERVIVRRVVAHEGRRKHVVGIDDERELEHAEAGARRLRPLALEPFAGRIEEESRRLARPGQGLEHHDVAEALAPVAVVAPVDHGRRARHDLAPLARHERPHPAALDERALAREDGELERDERAPARRAGGVHPIMEEDELGERVGTCGRLDADHLPSLGSLPRPCRESGFARRDPCAARARSALVPPWFSSTSIRSRPTRKRSRSRLPRRASPSSAGCPTS